MQELNSDFAKILYVLKTSGELMGKVPLQVLKELDHQARQNLCAINLRILSLRLIPSVTLSWRNARTVLCEPLRRSKARFKGVPILKK